MLPAVFKIKKKTVSVLITMRGGVEGSVSPATVTVIGAENEADVGVTVTYSDANGNLLPGVPTEAGVYTVTAIVNDNNFVSAPLSTTFTVKAQEPSGEGNGEAVHPVSPTENDEETLNDKPNKAWPVWLTVLLSAFGLAAAGGAAAFVIKKRRSKVA